MKFFLSELSLDPELDVDVSTRYKKTSPDDVSPERCKVSRSLG